MSRPQDAIAQSSRGESVEVAQKNGESASEEALPEGWAEAPLGEVVEIWDNLREPVNAKERATRQGPYPYYGANGQAGTIDDFRFDGDFALIAEDGGNFDEPEKGVAYRVTGQFWVNNHAHVLKGSCGMTSAFLVHLLNSMDWMPFVSGTTRLKLNQGKLKSAPLKVPPFAEQSRIVSAIESLQARSSRARVLLSEVGPLIGQLRQSVLRDAFSGKLTEDWRARHRMADEAARRMDIPVRPNSVDSSHAHTSDRNVQPTQETASELLLRIRTERRERWQSEQLAKYEAKGKQPPKNWQDKYREPDVTFDEDAFDTEFRIDKSCEWEVAPLELLVDPEKSIPYGIVKTGAPYPNGIPTVRCGDIKRFSIAINDLKLVNPEVHEQYRRTWLEGGEVIIAIRGTIGETAVVPAEMKGMNISREVALIPVLPGVDATFLMYLLASPAAQRLISGQVKGVAQSGINLSDLRMLPIPLPLLEEQQEIARRIEKAFETLDSVMASQASIKSSLTQLDQSILAKAFRGELVPQDPTDEPASELLARIRTAREDAAANSRSRKKKKSKAKAGD